MTRQDYCARVLGELRRATKTERTAVQRELDGHMEDIMEARMARGEPAGEAEARAVAAMGDPVETGRALDKQYSPFWLLLGRLAMAAFGLCLVLCLTQLGAVRTMTDSVTARLCPDISTYVAMNLNPATTSDLRGEMQDYTCWDTADSVPAGNDILRCYQAGLREENGTYALRCLFCNYDRNLWGVASREYAAYLTLASSMDAYQPAALQTYGWYGSEGAYFWVMTVTVDPAADEHVTASYNRLGNRVTMDVPIRWEVLA